MIESVVMPDGDELCESLFSAPHRKTALENLGGFRVYTDAPLDSNTKYLERCKLARAVIFGWPLPSDVLALPNLEVVTFMGTGAANFVDVDEARRRGIAVCNAPGYGDIAVAEHTMALILSSLRDVARLDARMRNGEWPTTASARELFGATVGIVGFGGIGARVSTLLAAMGAQVLCWTRNPEKYRDANPHVEFTDLETLLAQSAIVSLHLGLNSETEGIINTERLNLLQNGTLFVNTARAELVDTAHLLKLVEGQVISVALDVFSPEPLPSENPYRHLDGTVLTPHVAFNTPQAMERMADITVRNLEQFFAGSPQNRVA
jgi:D-3-phosphoglycerate dehydrogenase